MINVRRATIEDIPMIMEFLDEHWLKGYALANNRELFDWQFVKNGKVNVWIGVDDVEKKMYAMQGGIFYSSHMDADLSGMLWIAIKSNNPLLAIETTDSIYIESKPRAAYSMGLMEDAIKVSKKRGDSISYFDHYYRLADRKSYSIAIVNNKTIPPVKDKGYKLTLFTGFDEFKNIISEEYLCEGAPRKDYQYVEWRYWKHPMFKYDKWSISDEEGRKVAVMVTRDESYLESKSCKIVDYYGDSKHLGNIISEIDRIIRERNYEFVDIYSYGVPCEIYENGGYVRCEKESENIITNLFQPYTAMNTNIALITPSMEGTRLFRGDSDQDKPRFLFQEEKK